MNCSQQAAITNELVDIITVLRVYVNADGSYFRHALAPLNATVVIHLPQAFKMTQQHNRKFSLRHRSPKSNT
jgi:hypothetical protein